MENSDNDNQLNTTIEGPASRKLSSVMLPLCSGDEVARKSTDFRDGEALKTLASPIHQDNQRREPYELRSLSKKPVLDTLPATQQPLMPAQQGSEKKTCTPLSKDDVDWDEDLRPSDDNDPGGAQEETAIPMPPSFAGGTFFPQKSCDTTLKTKKPAKLPRAPGKTGAKVRMHKKSTRPPSQSPNRVDKHSADRLDCANNHSKQLPEKAPESRENTSAQEDQAIDFCGIFTTEDQHITPAAEKAGLESTNTSHTKKGKAVYGVEPGVRSEHQSMGGTTPLSTDGTGQEGRGKEVGKKLAAALGNAKVQPKSTNQGCKPINRDGSYQSSSNNQKTSKSAVTPSVILPLGGTTGSTESRARFHTTASFTGSQCEDRLLSHVELSAEQHSDPDRDFDDWGQQMTTDQLKTNDAWIESSLKDTRASMENSAYPTIPLGNGQNLSGSLLEHSRPSPRKLFIDKNGSPIVLHPKRTDYAHLRGGSSKREQDKQSAFSYRPKRSESGYEGGSEDDTLGEDNNSPGLATFPILSNKAFPPSGSGKTQGELSTKPDGPSAQRSGRANANASIEMSFGKAKENITGCDIHERTQKILFASTQHLAFQLEDERKSIDKILETYNQQCHLVLDQLFKAQEERIELCEQQMASIQTHQAKLRQELIDRLKAGGTQMMTRKRAHTEIPLRGQDPERLGQLEKVKRRRHDSGPTIDHDSRSQEAG